MHGLDAFILSGTNVVYNTRGIDWQPYSIATAIDASDVAEGVDRFGILQLEDEYIDPNVYDGTQWVFVLKQGDLTKRIYCSNRFPDRLRDFASWLDGVATQFQRQVGPDFIETTVSKISIADYTRYSEQIWNAHRSESTIPLDENQK